MPLLTCLIVSLGIDDVDEYARHHPQRAGQGGHQDPHEVFPQEAKCGCWTKWIAGVEKPFEQLS